MCDVGGGQWPEAQGPATIWLLAKAVAHRFAGELCLVSLRALISGAAVEGGVESVAAVVDWPDRKAIGYRSSGARKRHLYGHMGLIGLRCGRLDALGPARRAGLRDRARNPNPQEPGLRRRRPSSP